MIKTFKIALWIIAPVILISNINFDRGLSSEAVYSEECSLLAKGHMNEILTGVMEFETTSEKVGNGISFSVLKLRLLNKQVNPEYTMEFLISKQNKTGQIPSGSYGIAKDDTGLLNYFDGVFGFANINSLGELPFFATNGEITIAHSDSESVLGSMNVTLKNNDGKKFVLSGDFIASHH